MTKSQNRSHGFGKRSLSVLLAVLMVLSTLVVMISATSMSASADISYWFVSGNFNGWTQSATSANKINSGSGGSVTIPTTASSILFKMIAYEGGNKWCGNASGSATVGAETELSWDSGENISVALPANTTAVTFKLTVKNGKNYVTVTATTSGGGTGPTPVGDSQYTAKVNPSNSANSKDAIFWADATYYDYMSDRELVNGWLYPDHVGTSNFNGNIDEWYPFYSFNRHVVKSVADSNSGWSKPLYFGNFCNTYNAYDTSHHPGVTNGYNDATNSSNVTRFNYAANNSNGVYDMHSSVQGLMNSSLNNGMLQTPDGTLAPYFNEDALSGYAKTVKSAFPFRKIDKGNYMRYEFDSTNATDNVYFTWETKDGVTYPKYVNYGEGTAYGVKDGLKEFMNTNSGYGIFPFNNASSSYKGTKTKTNEQLDYGFGIRMDMKFRVPENTDVKFDFSGDDDLWMYITDPDGNSQLVLDMGGSHKESEGVVDFNNGVATVFDVDDPSATNKDIWVMEKSGWGNVMLYAWDNNNNGEWYTGTSSSNLYRFRDNLIGSNGNPLSSKTKFLYAKDTSFTGQSGDLNISNYTGKCIYTDNGSSNTSNTVGGHSKEAKNYFTFDPSKTYTMTIFYMERGLIESNCKMGFTLTPLGNNFIVTEEIRDTNVNAALKRDGIIKALSEFGFTPKNNGSQLSDAEYSHFTLGDGGRMEIPDSVLGINSPVDVVQDGGNSYLTYNTSWNYTDNVSSNRSHLDDNDGSSDKTGNGNTTTTSQQTLVNTSSDPPDLYDYAELQVDFVNEPVVGQFSVTKNIAGGNAGHESESFPATIYMQFKAPVAGKAATKYEKMSTYNLTNSNGVEAQNGRITLKPGVTQTFTGIPIGTRVYVVEDDPGAGYTPSYTYTSTNPCIVSASSGITVTNTPVSPDEITGDLGGFVKKLDGKNYTGDMFLFKLEGVNAGIAGDVDTSGMQTLQTNAVTNGNFSFSGLTFDREGTYRYRIYEDTDNLALIDASNLYETNFATDFADDGKQYLVSITVTKNGSNILEAGAPEYYNYNGNGTVTAADFAPAKKLNGSAVFNNALNTGSIKVQKKEQKGELVDGVTFYVLKADATILNMKNNGKTDAEIYDAIMKRFDIYDILVGQGTTGASGADHGFAQISDLKIYEDGFVTETSTAKSISSANDAAYQEYVLLEARGPQDYAINKTLNFFHFPINGQYDYTFSEDQAYVNGMIKNPAAGGIKGILFTGLGVVAFAAVLLIAYVLFQKKRVHVPAHIKK